jgi:hypothetical protein
MVGAETNAAVFDDTVKEAAMATLPLLLPFMIDKTVASISTADDDVDDDELIVIIDRDRLPLRLLVDDISLAVAGADAETMVCQCI